MKLPTETLTHVTELYAAGRKLLIAFSQKDRELAEALKEGIEQLGAAEFKESFERNFPHIRWEEVLMILGRNYPGEPIL